MALLTSKNTPENKVNKIVSFIQDLGANPFFVDSVEHDSYTVATSVLPFIFSTTLMNIVSESPSWHEMRQFAGKEFNNVTFPSKNLQYNFNNSINNVFLSNTSFSYSVFKIIR